MAKIAEIAGYQYGKAGSYMYHQGDPVENMYIII